MAVDLGSDRLMSAEQLLHSISYWKQRAETAETSLDDANAKIRELSSKVDRLSEELDSEKSARFTAESTSRIMNKKHSTLTGMITELSTKNEELEDKLKRLMRDPSSLRSSGGIGSDTTSKKRSASAVSFQDLLSGMSSSVASSTKSGSSGVSTSKPAGKSRTSPMPGRISVDATVMDDAALFGISEVAEMDTTAIEEDLSDLSMSGSAPPHTDATIVEAELTAGDGGYSERGRDRHRGPTRRLSQNELAVRAAEEAEAALDLDAPLGPPITPLVEDVAFTPIVMGDTDVAEVEPVGDDYAGVDLARLDEMLVRRSRSRSPSVHSVRSDVSVSVSLEEERFAVDRADDPEEMDQHGQVFVNAMPAANQNNMQNLGGNNQNANQN